MQTGPYLTCLFHVCNFYVRINAILIAIITSLHAAKRKTEIVIGGSLQDVTLSDAETGKNGKCMAIFLKKDSDA